METKSGFPGDCSEDQLSKLEAFRIIVEAMELTNPPYTDEYLLRFLRARKFDIPKTELMFKNFISWRKDNEIDNIQGRPIYIERIGMIKINEIFKYTTNERLLKYYALSYETLLNKIFPVCSKVAGQRIDQTLTILDLKGASMGMVNSQVYNFIQLASKLAQDNYPEILGNLFIINAPMLFSGIWMVIKPWLDEKTRNKIKILGYGYQKELEKFIDPENLPDFLGGKSSTEGDENLENNPGPWNNFGKEHLFSQKLEEMDLKDIPNIENISLEERKVEAEGNPTILKNDFEMKFEEKSLPQKICQNENKIMNEIQNEIEKEEEKLNDVSK